VSAINIYLWRASLTIFFFGLWEIISGPIVDKFWFSRPSDIAISLWASIQNGILIRDLGITFQETAIGYVYGVFVGISSGLALAQSEKVAEITKPFIMAIYGIPRIALAPVFILWFGIGLNSKVMMAALATFLLVFFNTYEGIRSCDLDLRNIARVLGASRWQLFWKVTLPNASPWIISGLRIAIPQALVAATVAEFIASTGGLGYRIMETTNTMNTAGTMGGILVLMLVVVVLNNFLDYFEDWILRWRPRTSDSARR
jgi:NitT/TauT family transport system permease protein